MNGFSTGEEDSRGAADQICCLVDEGERCSRPAGNASYSKRIQKTVTQRRLKLNLDHMVSHARCTYASYTTYAIHVIFIFENRHYAKRKTKYTHESKIYSKEQFDVKSIPPLYIFIFFFFLVEQRCELSITIGILLAIKASYSNNRNVTLLLRPLDDKQEKFMYIYIYT